MPARKKTVTEKRWMAVWSNGDIHRDWKETPILYETVKQAKSEVGPAKDWRFIRVTLTYEMPHAR